MNADGLSDFIIGAPEGGTNGEFDGEAYIVFGQVKQICTGIRFTYRTGCIIRSTTAVCVPLVKSHSPHRVLFWFIDILDEVVVGTMLRVAFVDATRYY